MKGRVQAVGLHPPADVVHLLLHLGDCGQVPGGLLGPELQQHLNTQEELGSSAPAVDLLLGFRSCTYSQSRFQPQPSQQRGSWWACWCQSEQRALCVAPWCSWPGDGPGRAPSFLRSCQQLPEELQQDLGGLPCWSHVSISTQTPHHPEHHPHAIHRVLATSSSYWGNR